jgi:anthranilate/para-aminobenzoate synthase component I
VTPQQGDSKCPQPKTGPRKAIGTVVSVAGNTINVTVTDANGNPSQTVVTVTDKTQYIKQVSATTQAIAQGKCITALGTKDGGGTLQATGVAVSAANDKGQCPQAPVKK